MTVKDFLLDDLELCLDYFYDECEDPDWEECESIMYSVSPEDVDVLLEDIVDYLYSNELDEVRTVGERSYYRIEHLFGVNNFLNLNSNLHTRNKG